MGFRELREMALEGTLQGHHQVWQLGHSERQKASSVMGLIPSSKQAPSDSTTSLKPSESSSSATQKIRTIADGPPGGLYLPHLHRANFPIFFLTLLVTAALFYAGAKTPDSDIKPVFYSLAGMSLSFWCVLALIYLHRAWEMMKMFGAHLNGAQAVRLLIIPLLNSLWCYVVLFGWARLWNRCVKTHPGLQPACQVWRPIFFLFPTLFFSSQIVIITLLIMKEWPTDLTKINHQVILGLFTATIVTGLICWFQLSQSINFLARKKS